MVIDPDRYTAWAEDSLAARHRPTRIVLAILVVSLILAGVVAGAKLTRVFQHLFSLATQANMLRQWAQDPGMALSSPAGRAALRSGLGTMRNDLRALYVEGGFMWRGLQRLGWAPVIGGDLQAWPALLQSGIHLTDAGLAGMAGIEPILAVYDPGSSVAPENATAESLWRLKMGASHFAEGQQAVASAQADLEMVPTQRLSPLLAKPVALANTYLPALQAAFGLAQGAPALLGADRPATYLILAQNSHELRPTGGLISGVGLLRIEGAKVISATLEDGYAADADCDCVLPAPAPLREYMWTPVLKLRDANWSPDLPATAAVVRSIYGRCQGVEVDGVIAVDLEAVGAVLDVLGPLQPEGYDTPVTRETFEELLAQYWDNPVNSQTMSENKDAWWLHRKDLMRDLLRELVRKAGSGLGGVPVRRGIQTALRMLQEKHLQIYVDEPAAQKALAMAAWDGAVQNRGGDYVLVADSNVGFRKVNPYIERQIDYRVVVGADGGARAALRLEYRNSSSGSDECIAGARYDENYQEMMQGCYWNYVRVYVPRGSRLLSVAGEDDAVRIAEEQGRTVFGLLVIVPPGQSRQVAFVYDLPPLEHVRGYELLVQKQAGLPEAKLHVSVRGAGRVLTCHGCSSGVHVHNGDVSCNLVGDTRIVWGDTRAWWGQVEPSYSVLAPGLLLLGASVFLARARRRSGSVEKTG